MKLIIPTILAAAASLVVGCKPSGTGDSGSARQKIAYVTNGVDPFWDLCAGGVRQAEKEFGIVCEVHMPNKGLVDQKRLLETLVAKGIGGIAVSPIDAEGQTADLNEIAKQTKLITQDADAPKSARLCYIGAHNYKAGRAVGKLAKEALPEGGEVMIFVGRLEQLNAQQRRQGAIDELLDRPDPGDAELKFDPVSGVIKGAKFTVLDTRTDDFDKARAKANAEDAMTKHEKLAGMIALFAYNPAACLDAVKEAGKLGKIKIVGFDEQDAALQGIKDGSMHGTISQQPWRYGYESVRMLKQLLAGDSSAVPASKYLEIPFLVVTKANIDEFWAEKKKMESLGKQP
jgi:ribose transport system substrate-binding protein